MNELNLMRRYAGRLADATNEMHGAGLDPERIMDVLAATIIATAKKVGRADDDIFQTFVGFGWSFRPALGDFEHATPCRETFGSLDIAKSESNAENKAPTL